MNINNQLGRIQQQVTDSHGSPPLWTVNHQLDTLIRIFEGKEKDKSDQKIDPQVTDIASIYASAKKISEYIEKSHSSVASQVGQCFSAFFRGMTGRGFRSNYSCVQDTLRKIVHLSVKKILKTNLVNNSQSQTDAIERVKTELDRIGILTSYGMMTTEAQRIIDFMEASDSSSKIVEFLKKIPGKVLGRPDPTAWAVCHYFANSFGETVEEKIKDAYQHVGDHFQAPLSKEEKQSISQRLQQSVLSSNEKNLKEQKKRYVEQMEQELDKLGVLKSFFGYRTTEAQTILALLSNVTEITQLDQMNTGILQFLWAMPPKNYLGFAHPDTWALCQHLANSAAINLQGKIQDAELSRIGERFERAFAARRKDIREDTYKNNMDVAKTAAQSLFIKIGWKYANLHVLLRAFSRNSYKMQLLIDYDKMFTQMTEVMQKEPLQISEEMFDHCFG